MITLSPGQGVPQLAELALALVLSAVIGLEREARNKSAGLRTHTLVGLGAALFMLVSKYGFSDVPGPHVSLDPSRVAAQIVSGIGFIGGGLIFVRRDAVRGLTTAAVVWVTAAVGMACGGGLPVLAVTVTALHFFTVFVLNTLGRRLPLSRRTPSQVRVVYWDATGALRRVLVECTERNFVVAEVSVERGMPEETEPGRDRGDRRDRHDLEARRRRHTVAVTLVVEGKGSIPELTAALGEMPDILSVTSHEGALGTD
ncbi:MgtC/SapB family protein [Streptosporangium sp. NPDC051023]|uniref:MgtC/SapB family protein n=1 Tax=Streptosporangium sp. NPDC051023 TaxID=3155410 RepID=UPI00344BA643